MSKNNVNIHIVGAGISGLIAAKVLEENGFSPVIIESSNRAGGRVKTDIIDGYQLDRGFQVLLTDYPAAKKFLDFDALALQKFVPGAAIFYNGKKSIMGDAFRDSSLLFSTIFSNAGSIVDKLKVLKLNNQLKKKKLHAIFLDEEKTTYQYLIDFGFSDKIISRFFKPFFGGIFLESELTTSSRMFEFVYKMFGEGLAVLPKEGIEDIVFMVLS
jgi:protoporphyrinogen oxidase